MSSKPKIHIVILNWNGEQDTISLLASLKNIDYHDYEIILIDNGSSIDSFTTIASWLGNGGFTGYTPLSHSLGGDMTIIGKGERIVFIRSGSNLGFAKGSNSGIKYALEQGGEYILLLNNDTEVLPDFLTKMVEQLMTFPFPDAIVPQIRYYHDKNKIWNCGGRLFFGFRKYYYSGKSYKKLPARKFFSITFATGCALLFKPGNVGLLTEKFFFGEEDIDFSYRLMKQNKKMICATDAIIYHKVGQSLNSSSKKVNKGAVFIHYLNRFVNIKNQFQNMLIWNIWRFIYSFYILFLITGKFSLKELYRFMRLLWIKSSLLTEVSKQEFDSALTEFSNL